MQASKSGLKRMPAHSRLRPGGAAKRCSVPLDHLLWLGLGRAFSSSISGQLNVFTLLC